MEMKDIIAGYQKDVVAWRRDFHAHPETGFEEYRTSKRIIEILNGMDLEIVHDFCKTAVIAIIRGKHDGPVIGLRADIDALPLPDEKDVPYKSQNPGVCHACGHDAHTAMGLAVARYFSEHPDQLHGTLKVVFQPAEEGPAPGGARLVIDSGAVSDLDYMIGFHAYDVPTGTLLLRRNEILASGDNLKITIKGTGGHGAYPHQTIDPLRTGIEIYNAFQTLMTREVDPTVHALLSICSFNAGTPKGTNVIPAEITMSGTIRTLDNDARDFIIERIRTIVDAICEMNGCTYELNIEHCSIALINDDRLMDLIETVGSEVFGQENLRYLKRPEMGYDDFANYSQVAKAAYFYIGTTPADVEKIVFHTPTYDLDECAFPAGIEMLCKMIQRLKE